jgi:hypothetical protein
MNQYYCPFCRSPVAVGEGACRRCGRTLTWTPVAAGHQDDGRQEDDDIQPRANRSWLWPLLALVVIVVLAAVGIYIFLRMLEKPPVAPAVQNPASDVQEGLIIPDTRAPVISNIDVNDLSYNSVEIKWTTDEPSTSQVIWRMGDGPMTGTDEKDAMVNQHVVGLTGLKDKQMYYFKVRSVDQYGNEAISVEDSFDIGLSQGVASIGVVGGSKKAGIMNIEETQPGVFRTAIKGEVENTGEVRVRTRDIEVWITITVAGKAGTSEVKAELDPRTDILKPRDKIEFRAVVPNRTDPGDWVVTAKIVVPQD